MTTKKKKAPQGKKLTKEQVDAISGGCLSSTTCMAQTKVCTVGSYSKGATLEPTEEN
jgi:hypothetical protein